MSFTEKALSKINDKHGVIISLMKQDYAERKDPVIRKAARYYLNALEVEGIITNAEARAIFSYITL